MPSLRIWSVPPESNQATSRLSDGRSATEPGTENEVDSRIIPAAPGPRRLRRRQTISLVLTIAYGYDSAPNRPSSSPRSTMARARDGMIRESTSYERQLWSCKRWPWEWPETQAAPGDSRGLLWRSFDGGWELVAHPAHPDSRSGPRCTWKFLVIGLVGRMRADEREHGGHSSNNIPMSTVW